MKFTEVVLRRKLNELKDEGYKLYIDYVNFSSDGRKVNTEYSELLKSLSVPEDIINNMGSLHLLFKCSNRSVTLSVVVNKFGDLLFKISSSRYRKTDIIYSKPIFYNILLEYDLIEDNIVLWSVFRNRELLSRCNSHAETKIVGLESSDLVENLLLEDGFFKQCDNGFYKEYISSARSSLVKITISNCLWSVYYDYVKYNEYKLESSEELGVDLSSVKCEFILDNVNKEYSVPCLGYSSVIDYLKKSGYCLNGIASDIYKSITNSITVLEFVSDNSVLYISSYFCDEMKLNFDYRKELVNFYSINGKTLAIKRNNLEDTYILGLNINELNVL